MQRGHPLCLLAVPRLPHLQRLLVSFVCFVPVTVAAQACIPSSLFEQQEY